MRNRLLGTCTRDCGYGACSSVAGPCQGGAPTQRLTMGPVQKSRTISNQAIHLEQLHWRWKFLIRNYLPYNCGRLPRILVSGAEISGAKMVSNWGSWVMILNDTP